MCDCCAGACCSAAFSMALLPLGICCFPLPNCAALQRLTAEEAHTFNQACRSCPALLQTIKDQVNEKRTSPANAPSKEEMWEREERRLLDETAEAANWR